MRLYYPQCRVNLFMVPVGERDALGIEAISPRQVTVEQTSPNEADTFEVTFDATNFPADPSALRNAVVDVRLADTKRPGEDLNTRGDDAQVVIGNIDEHKENVDKGTITLTGRDYSALLLDEEWGEARRIELGRPLDEMIREVLEGVPTTDALELSLELEDVPTIPKGKGRKGAHFQADASKSVWEALQDLAIMGGAILLIRGDQVVLREPRTARPGAADPVPVFVDGTNLVELEVSRDFQTKDLPNVRVKATDPETRETITGEWPDPPQETVKVTRGKDGTKKERKIEWHNMLVEHPAPTEEILETVARRVFEGWRQQQLTASWSTKEMRVSAGEMGREVDEYRAHVDAAAISSGRPVRLHVDRTTRREILDRSLTPAAKEVELRRRGFRRRVAQALAQHWQILDRIMYVDRATHQFSTDEGYSLQIDAVNAVEV